MNTKVWVTILNTAGSNVLFAVTENHSPSITTVKLYNSNASVFTTKAYSIGESFRTAKIFIEKAEQNGWLTDVTSEMAKVMVGDWYETNYLANFDLTEPKGLASMRLTHTRKYFSKEYHYLVSDDGFSLLAEGFNKKLLVELRDDRELTSATLRTEFVNPINSADYCEFMIYW